LKADGKQRARRKQRAGRKQSAQKTAAENCRRKLPQTSAAKKKGAG
jgi:hypothetical protein